MKRTFFVTLAALGVVVATTLTGRAQTTNAWKALGPGKWEDPGNWTAGSPSSLHAKEVLSPVGGTAANATIDATTSGGSPGTMTISNLAVSGRTGILSVPATLLLSNAGQNTPLEILNAGTVTRGGTISMTNSLLYVSGYSVMANAFAVDGSVEIDSNSELSASGESVGASSQGTLVVAGGHNLVHSNPLTIGDGPGSIGTLWVKSGELDAYTFAEIGNNGAGVLAQSNGIVSAGEEDVGVSAGSQGTLSVAGGDHYFGALYVGVGSTGTVWVTGGRVLATNDSFMAVIGSFAGVGLLTQSNGLMEVFEEIVAQGTLTVAGGTHLLGDGGLTVGEDGLTGTVWLTGGQLLANNNFAFTDIGYEGPGSLTQSNGIVEVFGENVGSGFGSHGTLTVAGGTHIVGFGGLAIGLEQLATGTVWVTGGQLLLNLLSSYITIGAPDSFGSGVGSLTQSNGTVDTFGESVGGSTGAQGTLTVVGGTHLVADGGLTIGTADCTGTGTVVVAGGTLYVTNGAHNATLDLENGTLTLSGGTLVADILVKTNQCASFKQTGGTLVVGGVTNTIGSFQITAIGQEGSNIRITWMDAGGHTNIVQATNGLGGNYATNFIDLSPQIILPGFGTVSTNYTDLGGATNKPARYYRIGLVP